LFPGVDGNEGSAHQARRGGSVGTQHACQVTSAGLLDLDDLSAQQSKLEAAKGPGENVGDIQHSNAGKRECHPASVV
jgi:hypothetical protein